MPVPRSLRVRFIDERGPRDRSTYSRQFQAPAFPTLPSQRLRRATRIELRPSMRSAKGRTPATSCPSSLFESSCVYPYITVGSEGIAGTVPTDPTRGELTIQRLNVGEPFSSCGDNSLTLIMKGNTLDPQNTCTAVLPPDSESQIPIGVTDTSNKPQTYSP